jgi:predicted ATPase
LIQIHTLLNDPACRLLTLVGPGGIGKTRLALAAAQNLKSKIQNLICPDGIFFVPLADVVTPDRLAMTIAGVVQFTLYRRDEEPLQQLIHYLADKQILLVLDNFEHLVTGAAQVTTLLAQAPGVKILTTSRERLNVQGEWLLAVSGLLYTQDAPLHQMADYSAVQLFVQCARRINNGFVLDEENKGAVARICRLVEGLPLALELAATWLRHLPCQELVAELEQSLTTLTATQRDLPARHRSVRALFDYSWLLLSDEERAVMERLSIFRSGFRREAARAVAEAPLPTLMALVDKSLLRSDSAGRFSMHELVRQFAAEGLTAQSLATEEIAQRHFNYYTTWLQQQRGQLHRKAQKQVLGEILVELENIRAAWRRALHQQHLPAITAALDTLADVHELCGWFHEGEAVFQEAVTAFAQATDEQQRRLQGRLQARLGFFAQRLAKYSSAQQLLQETYAKLHALGDLATTSYCLNCLGEIARITGDYEEAERCLTESIALCRSHGDRQLLSRAYNLLGIVYGVRGRHDEAQQLFSDSLALSEAAEDQLGIAKALNNLGIMAYFAGDYSAAQRFYQGSLNINQDLGHQYDTALALSNLGLVAQKQRRFEDAVAIFEESIAIQRKIGYELGVGLSLRNLCATLLDLEQLDAAATHLQEVLYLAHKIRNPPLGLAGLLWLAQLYRLREDWPRTACLAALVHHHPATEDEFRTKAADLLVAAQSHLATAPLAAAVAAAEEADLWLVVAEVMSAS